MRRLIAVLALTVPSAVQAQQKVPLVLNHLTIVLDSATYHDVRNSPFMLGQFAAVDTALGLAAPRGAGLGLLGRYNFLLFGGPRASHAEVGDVDIVLGVERPGGLATLASLTQPDMVAQVSADETPKAPPPLYSDFDSNVLTPRSSGAAASRMRFRVVQYRESAGEMLAHRDSLPAGNLSTSRFLAPGFDSRRLLSHLTAATLAISVDDIKAISSALQRDGVLVVAEGEGAIIKLDGFTLHLVPSFIGAGVKQLQFALTRTALGNPIYQFGQKSQLKFGPGPIAVWNFNWP